MSPPKRILQKPKEVHHRIVQLAAEGYMYREIAKIVGKSTQTVSNTIKQPWAQEVFPRLIREYVERRGA
jgi:transposase-like protein